jgi:tetratricopeptide (TPR) repeat protein
MSARDDWYRNKEWNKLIAATFAARLRRARQKEQYLRIQASYLAHAYPNVALELLDQYFELGGKFDHATAYVTRGEAFLALGKISEALDSYEAALRREDEFPNVKTLAYVEYPYLIAVHDLSSHYDRALDVLDRRKSDLMFPTDHFMWHAARAIILSAIGQSATAREDARAALDAAGQDHSGFSHHPKVGLVGDKHAEALRRLQAFHDA